VGITAAEGPPTGFAVLGLLDFDLFKDETDMAGTYLLAENKKPRSGAALIGDPAKDRHRSRARVWMPRRRLRLIR
jgi:hypothetical protein